MMQIVWHSNAPWVPTGYGQQTAEFTPRIRDLGHNVAISAYWGLGGAIIDWDGMRVYPADDKVGNRTLAGIAHDHGGDDCLVITLTDVWPLVSESIYNLPRLAAWVPIDHDPVPPRVAEFFERSGARPIAMSRFGQDRLQRLGLDPLYVPHGINTSTFQPRDTRDEVRDLLGIPRDAFVVGMVAANKGTSPPRKSFPQVFQAFARFREKHPDAYLYLHTDVAGFVGGVNLGALAHMCGIPSDCIKYTPQWTYELGLPPEQLSHLYSMMDVLANPSHGEGFGIPIIESQACGTPVIVTDWTAMPELCGAGWKVGGEPWYDVAQGSYFMCPSVKQIANAMKEAHAKRGDERLRTKARAFALGYDADVVMRDHWMPVLDELTAPAPGGAPEEPEVFVR